MIELNLTYEESKKILDLGYDFRRVSSVFVNEQGRFYNRANNYLAVARDITLYEIDQRPDLIPAFFRFIDHLTPIIPKGALEACLPELEEERHVINARVWLGKDLYAVQEDCIYSLDSDGSGYGSYDLERLKDQGFNSAFEAFTWCHEHYRKELKDKFNAYRLDLL